MKKYQTFIGVNMSVFLLMLGVGMIVALLPKRILDLSGSVEQVGYLASTFAIAYVLLQVPIGRMSDKIGFKPFLFLGYILCSFTGLLYYFSDSVSMVFGGRVLQGAGEAPIWALAPAVLSIMYPNVKGRVMGFYNASLHLGLTAGPLLGIAVMHIWSGNESFLIFAVLSLLGGLISLAFVGNPATQDSLFKERPKFTNVTFLFKQYSLLSVLIGIVLYGAGYGIFLTVIPAYLIREQAAPQELVGIFFALFYVAISVAQIGAGIMSDKKGRKPFIIYGLMLTAIGLFCVPFFELTWIIVFLTIASLGLGMFYISSMAFLNDCVSDHFKGTISGSYYLLWGIGFFGGPIFAGKVGVMAGFDILFFALACLYLSEAAIMLKIKSKM
jgi:MFS family permease